MLRGYMKLSTPFHLVEVRAWPILRSIGGLGITFGSICWWHYNIKFILILSLLLVAVVSFCWFGNVVSEKIRGFHKRIVMKGLRAGMLLFILSEVLFFFSFFWRFFHNCWGRLIWPPYMFDKIIIDPFSIPLLKTVVLLASGVRITWAHHRIISESRDESLYGLLITCLLGFYFLILQGREYATSFLSINSSKFGTVFFTLTGFHGLHVTIGFILLTVCFIRHFLTHFRPNQHVGLEASAWYWHFVDVVWLFLYLFIYWYSCPII